MYDPHHFAAGQAPYGYPPVRRRRRWPWWVVGVAVVALLVVAVVIVARGQDHPAAPPPAASGPAPTSSATAAPTMPTDPGISVASLPSYLASAQQISAHLAGVEVTAGALIRKPFSGFTVDPFECTGAVIPGSDFTYSGSHFTSFAGQPVSDAANDHKVIQAVTLLPDASAAAAFFTTQARQWKRCSDNKPVIVGDTNTGKADATVSTFDFTDDVASVLITPTGSTRQCQHAMTASRNVIVDVRVCVPTTGGSTARDIVRELSAAIDASH